nr:methyl-accepting chemotaxis protein [uncultured Carboxylicivirga sp.]
MNDILLSGALMVFCIPLAYLILQLIFGKSIMVEIGRLVALLVFLSCQMFYIVGKLGNHHFYWAIPILFVLGTSIFYYINISLIQPILRAIHSITELSKGNLKYNYNEVSNLRNETKYLHDSIIILKDKFIQIVTEVQSNSKDLEKISQYLSVDASNLANSSFLQASSLQQISATIEEYTSMVKQNSTNAKESERIANVALTQMSHINKQINDSHVAVTLIAKKINIVNQIAMQTNILALNASIESTKAGASGKGFKVVANEVKQLAELSKKAADEIVALANDSAFIVNQFSSSIDETLPHIEEALKMVKEIQYASAEQLSGVIEIGNAINELDKVSQKNARASEIGKIKANDLALKANNLSQLITFFRIN